MKSSEVSWQTYICFTASPELPAKFIHWGWLFLGPTTLDQSWWFVWSAKVTPLENVYCVLSICTHVAVELSLTPRWNFVWNLGLWIIIVVTITMGRVSGAKACRELDWMACGLEHFSVMTSVVWSDVIPFARAISSPKMPKECSMVSSQGPFPSALHAECSVVAMAPVMHSN